MAFRPTATRHLLWSLVLLGLFLLQPTLAQYFDGFDAFAQHSRRCKLYSCDKGYEPVPNKKMIFQSPGCGAMGHGGGMDLFGGDDEDDEDGKPYEECCHQWHACQQICGISKQHCDDAYEQCTETKCKDKYHKGNTGDRQADKDAKDSADMCMEDAKQSMMMNNLSGCKSFEMTQSKACVCETKYGGRHQKKREESLHHFYKKYAPKEIRKVSALAKKADTMTKMAKLMAKLLQKYPEAIELVEDPQSKMYRQMFGNSGGFGGADFGDFQDMYKQHAGGAGAGAGADDFDDIDDFDVDEGLGSYEDEEEEEEVPPPPPPKKKKRERKPERKKPEKMQMKKDPPPPPVEEEPAYDEFDQYQEL